MENLYNTIGSSWKFWFTKNYKNYIPVHVRVRHPGSNPGNILKKVELPKNELQNFTKSDEKNYKNLEKSSKKIYKNLQKN